MLTSAQIIAIACTDARLPGYATLSNGPAGQKLNAILSELSETYDWEATKVLFNGNLNPAVLSTNPNLVPGQGPTNLPANYLRMVPNTFVWFFSGIPYPLTPWDDAEFDATVQQVGIASLARSYITDLSNPAQPVFFVYPPTNGAYPYQGRCHVRMPDIGSNVVAATGWAAGAQAPEISAVVPWFPNTTYLSTRLTGELMRTTGDRRMHEFLGKNRDGTGAQDILERILQMKDDRESRAQTIKLDRRRFGSSYRSLPDTKNLPGP